MPSGSSAGRTARYTDAMRARGFVKKHLWVPAEFAGELEAEAARLRRSRRSPPPLDRVLASLRDARAELEASGVRSVGVFGSLARGEAGPGSDVDLLVDLDPAAPIGLFAFEGLRRRLEERLGHPIDLVTLDSLGPRRRAEVLHDLAHAF